MNPPPIGLLPRWRWLEHRALDIIHAIERYIEHSAKVPKEWPDELARVLDEIEEERAFARIEREAKP